VVFKAPASSAPHHPHRLRFESKRSNSVAGTVGSSASSNGESLRKMLAGAVFKDLEIDLESVQLPNLRRISPPARYERRLPSSPAPRASGAAPVIDSSAGESRALATGR